jgi:3D (Asp-Asp-Asp) domain-containing protein
VTRALIRQLLFAATAILAVILLSSCGTTGHVRSLPPFEAPLAKTDFQKVRTTAYTHTEADHVQYTNHNALGGELHAASEPIHRAEYVPRALPVDEESDYQLASYSVRPQRFSADDNDEPAPKAKPVKTARASAKAKTTMRNAKNAKTVKRATALRKPKPPVIGSAAADWARWPAGTTFRLLSTGQIYRVDDYGWALSGRNTIDLYMANSREMNSWGAREEPIQILHWGDAEESARVLQGRQGYKHIRRMLLEIDGRYEEAAQVQ